MKKIECFEDLEVWKEAMRLCIKIYDLLQAYKDYGFKDQIQRAAVSVPSNISEGYERQTNKEFIQFLYIAKGSCGELRTQLYLAKELKYIESEQFKMLLEKAKYLSSMLYSFIKVRKTNFK
jgi:four helix bundle protein